MRVPSMDEIMDVAQSQGAVSEAPWLWDGLVFAAPLQEGSGYAVRDACRVDDVGALVNTTTTEGWSLGVNGRALALQNSGRVEFLRFPVLRLEDSPTISVWLRPLSTEQYARVIFGHNQDGGVRMLVKLYETQPNQLVSQWLTTGTKTVAMNIVPISFGQWIHAVTMPHNVASMHHIYINGSLAAGSASSYTITGDTSVSSIAGIGRYPESRSGLDGQVSNVAIWRRRLSPADVAFLYADPWAMYRLRRRVYAVPRIPVFIKRRSLGLRAGSREAVI